MAIYFRVLDDHARCGYSIFRIYHHTKAAKIQYHKKLCMHVSRRTTNMPVCIKTAWLISLAYQADESCLSQTIIIIWCEYIGRRPETCKIAAHSWYWASWVGLFLSERDSLVNSGCHTKYYPSRLTFLSGAQWQPTNYTVSRIISILISQMGAST